MFTNFTPADLVSILNSINVPVCFTVMVAGVTVFGVKRALQRSDDLNRRQAHAEKMERLRLSNTKEIVHCETRDFEP